MTGDKQPMDPERLAEMRDSEDGAAIITPDRVAELLAHVDWQARELTEASKRTMAEHSKRIEAESRAVTAETEVAHWRADRDAFAAEAQRQSALHRDAQAFIRRTTDTLGELFVAILGEDAPGGGPLESKAERCLAVLAAKDAEIARLRSRVQVTAGDVERAGVTRAHVEAWLRAAEWAKDDSTDVWRRENPRGRFVMHGDHPGQLADGIHACAFHHERPSFDILDEMAAMPAEGEGA